MVPFVERKKASGRGDVESSEICRRHRLRESKREACCERLLIDLGPDVETSSSRAEAHGNVAVRRPKPIDR